MKHIAIFLQIKHFCIEKYETSHLDEQKNLQFFQDSFTFPGKNCSLFLIEHRYECEQLPTYVKIKGEKHTFILYYVRGSEKYKCRKNRYKEQFE